jgi:hypothetical protein
LSDGHGHDHRRATRLAAAAGAGIEETDPGAADVDESAADVPTFDDSDSIDNREKCITAYRNFIALGAVRCDRDVGLHVLIVTFLI